MKMAYFNFDNVYSYTRWMVTYDKSHGYADKFLKLIDEKTKQTEFPNVITEIEEYDTGGWFNAESSTMLCVKFDKSKFKKFGLFFRASEYGNAVLYSMLKTIEKGFWDHVKDRTQSQVIANIKSNCSNLSQLDEFEALTSLGDIVFNDTVRSLDPNFESNKHLFLSKAA
jgi:hypothetical protein